MYYTSSKNQGDLKTLNLIHKIQFLYNLFKTRTNNCSLFVNMNLIISVNISCNN